MEKHKLGAMPVKKLIIHVSLPVIFSMLVQALYNIVDSMFVSRISENALTAVSLSFPIHMIIVAAFVGLGTGINAMISRKLGEKDVKTAILVSEHGAFIGVILWILVAITGFIFSFFFFQLFTAEQEIIDYGASYIRIITMFSFGSILTHTGMSSLQGSGEMIKPMKAQLIGALLNIILDPIFIFGYFGLPAMGVAGAAIATVIAQSVAMVYIWSRLLKGDQLIRPDLKDFRFKSHIVKEMIKIGFPSAVMQGMASLMLSLLNLILSGFGETALAVMGVYFRLQSMVFMPMFGLATGTMPVVGYSFGAKDRVRLIQGVRFSATLGASFMLFAFMIFQIFPNQLLSLFNATEAMYAIGIPAIRTISFMFPMVGITIILSTSFQALGKAHFSLMIAITRQMGVLLPAAFILGRVVGIHGVWYAFILAEGVGFLMTLTIFTTIYRKQISHWELVSHEV